MKLKFNVTQTYSGSIIADFPEDVTDEQAKQSIKRLLEKGEITIDDFKYLNKNISVDDPQRLKHDIQISEFYSRIVSIEADSPEEALLLVEKLYNNESIVLDEQDFVTKEIDIYEENV